MIKVIDNPEEVIAFAWELCQDDSLASYGRIKSYDHLQEQLEKAVKSKDRELIAYFENDELIGVCFYFWISSDKYAQTTGFLIRENYKKVADQFINYIADHLPGYELFIGVPSTNKHAINYFKEKNIPSVEDSIVTVMYNLAPHKSRNRSCIEEIIKNNFEDYAGFHDKYAIPNEMYWTSDKLVDHLDRYRVFAFKDNGAVRGSIFVMADEEISDIVGLFIDEEYKQQGIEKDLINEMLAGLYNEFGQVEEILFFIDEKSSYDLEIALEIGFEVKEKYKLYKCTL